MILDRHIHITSKKLKKLGFSQKIVDILKKFFQQVEHYVQVSERFCFRNESSRHETTPRIVASFAERDFPYQGSKFFAYYVRTTANNFDVYYIIIYIFIILLCQIL